MSFVEQFPQKGAKVKGKPRGRPKGWRKPKVEGQQEPSYTTIRVHSFFKAQMDYERQEREKIADTVQRLFKEKGSKIIELENKLEKSQQEIDRLKTELENR
jgi:hypothetical protein